MAYQYNFKQVSGALRQGYIARREAWPGDTNYITAVFVLSQREMLVLMYPGKKESEQNVAVADIHGWSPSPEDEAATDWEIRGTIGSMMVSGNGGVKDEAGG